MIYIFLWAYFTNTNILKGTVIIWSSQILPVGSNMVLKMPISRKKMLIFNTVFDPTGKSWGDQIIYSHF